MINTGVSVFKLSFDLFTFDLFCFLAPTFFTMNGASRIESEKKM